MTDKKTFVIAIDGPAASGKGTLARKLAKELGYAHLDTGLTYRAVAHELTTGNLPLNDESIAVEIAQDMDFRNLDRKLLSAHETGEAASKIAIMKLLRKTLVNRQREFVRQFPKVILDGRDIATVVCPDANVKLFVTASPEIRARRRFEEIASKNHRFSYERILQDIRARDKRDMKRKDSPLKQTCSAHLIDTSKMDIQSAFEMVLAIVGKAQIA